MRAEDFVSRLQKVRRSGPNRYLACCPAHDDRSPSLTVSDGQSGHLLIKCFAGCGIEDICGAVGVSLTEIMPEREAPLMPIKRERLNPMDVLRAMHFQAIVVAIAASDMAQGLPLSREEKNKLFAIAGEFQQAIELTGGA